MSKYNSIYLNCFGQKFGAPTKVDVLYGKTILFIEYTIILAGIWYIFETFVARYMVNIKNLSLVVLGYIYNC